ncbi:MAG: NUDIX hydrolase [Clostridia bacterium]
MNSKLISEEIKYNGVRFKVLQKVYESEKGLKYIRDCVDTKDAAIILPVDEDENIVFIKQMREVIGEVTLELPAGVIENGEDPGVTAKRELEEETGIIAKSITHLITVYASCGYSNEKIHIYLAKDFEKGRQNFDEDEEITAVEKIHIDKCLKLIEQNFFKQANMNLAILMYEKKRNK